MELLTKGHNQNLTVMSNLKIKCNQIVPIRNKQV